MNNFFTKIKNIMYGCNKRNQSPVALVLYLCSLGYCGAVKLRELAYKNKTIRSKRLSCAVISIGNITVGGTGKTPMTIYIAKLMKELGYKAAVISRGYKGGAEKIGGVVSNGRKICMGPEQTGDEPYMIALNLTGFPVAVGQNRFEAGKIVIKKFDPDVIILDDAFQHLKIDRDINIVLLDKTHPVGNTCLIPRGILREPVAALQRGDVFILTRSDNKRPEYLPQLRKFTRDKPVFESFHEPYIFKIVPGETGRPGKIISDGASDNFDFLKNKNLYLFSGIAVNNDFYRSVKKLKGNIKGFLEFSDHYEYSDKDFDNILQSAKKANADFIITTEKDYARIAHRVNWPIDLLVIGVEIVFKEKKDIFHAFIKNRLEHIVKYKEAVRE